MCIVDSVYQHTRSLYTYIPALTHKFTHTYIHTKISTHPHAHTHKHACMNANSHTCRYIHTYTTHMYLTHKYLKYVYILMHKHVYTRIYVYTHACCTSMYTNSRSCTHARLAHMNKHTHTYKYSSNTYTHARIHFHKMHEYTQVHTRTQPNIHDVTLCLSIYLCVTHWSQLTYTVSLSVSPHLFVCGSPVPTNIHGASLHPFVCGSLIPTNIHSVSLCLSPSVCVWLTNPHEHAQSLSLLLSHLFVCGSLDQTTIQNIGLFCRI